MEQIRKRINRLLSDNALNVNRACKLLDIPQRTLNRQLNEGKGISTELICAVKRCFPDVSVDWIFSGKGRMYNDSGADMSRTSALPYYNSLPVSAGVRDVVDGASEVPDEYISIPGVKAEFFFPVTGASMQPEINPGDIIGVNRVGALERFDEDKTYMIVTRDERMIKHCRIHPDDNNLIECTSPNYPSFPLRKEDVLAIYDVVVKISAM